MTNEKVKQFVGMVGGALASLLMFLGTINIKFDWFTTESVDAFVVVLGAMIPLGFAFYGIWKNTYLVTKKAKREEEELKRKGFK